MQNYDNKTNSNHLARKFLSDFLGFLKYKVDHGLMTLDEVEQFADLMRHSIEISGTSDDFARYFRQLPVTVRSMLTRKYIGRPKRKVLYSFNKFLRIVPERWLCCSKTAGKEDDASGGK